MREFDVVVMGAGVAGEVAAGRLGQNGLSVAVVEDRLVGGECSFYACMPSKALLRPVELAARGRARGRPLDRPDRRACRARAARRGDLEPRRLGPAAVARGARRHARPRPRAARRRAPRVVDGGADDGEELVARKAVIVATGSSALIPDIDGLREARPWTNIEATTANEVPARLAILGGGVVGVEMAQAWSAFGSTGHPRPPRRPADRAGGAVRGRAGARGARGGRRRRPARAPGDAGDRVPARW